MRRTFGSGDITLDTENVNIDNAALEALIGEVQASPTANTLLDRVKTLSTLIGEVQANPTDNTVLDRLKDLLTGIILAEGTNIVGKVGIDQTTDGTTNKVAVGSIAAGTAKIGTVNIRNNADSANIDPLAEATFTGRVGEVQASPTANTVLDRLKTLATLIGEVQENPTDNTLLDRLKDIKTALDSLTVETDTTDLEALVGEVQESPTTNTVLDRLKTINTTLGSLSVESDTTDLEALVGEVQASPTQYTLLDRVKSLLTGISLAAGTNLLGKVGIDQTTDGTTNKVAVGSISAGTNKIGSINIRNNADNANIDPLAETTFTGRIGEVQASPTANTVLDRLKTLSTLIGEVQASPTENTLLARLKDLLSGIVLATGSHIIGQVGIDQTTDGTTNKVSVGSIAAGTTKIGSINIRNNADSANIDPLAESTFTARIGEVQETPTENTVLDRLKTINTTLGSLSVETDTSDLETLIGEVQASPTANTLLDRVKALLTGIVLNTGSNVIGQVSINQTTDGTTNKVQARNATHGDFQVNATIQLADTDVSNTNAVPVKVGKGSLTTSHNAVEETTTSAEIDTTGYNAVMVYVEAISGGTWKVDIQGAAATGGTFVNLYDNYDNQLTTGNLTAARARLFVGVGNFIKVVATEVVDGGACTVKVLPMVV